MYNWLIHKYCEWRKVHFNASLTKVAKNSSLVDIHGQHKILVDNCLINDAFTHRTCSVRYGKIMDTIRVEVLLDTSDKMLKKDRIKRNLSYLVGIIGLAKHGKVAFYTSRELKRETFPQPMYRFREDGFSFFDFNLFSLLDEGVRNCIDNGIDSKTGYLDSEVFIRNVGHPLETDPEQKKRLIEEQRKVIRLKLKRMEFGNELLQTFPEKDSNDIFHVLQAYAEGCLCFLTTDFKFVARWKEHKSQIRKLGIKVLVLTPEEFGKMYGIKPVNPYSASWTDVNNSVIALLAQIALRSKIHNARYVYENGRIEYVEYEISPVFGGTPREPEGGSFFTNPHL